MLRRLDWCALPLDLLSDRQIATIDTWVERELAAGRHPELPGTWRVVKERREGATGRPAWRWVVYVGESPALHQVAVRTTKRAARDAARLHHAAFFADFARGALEGRRP